MEETTQYPGRAYCEDEAMLFSKADGGRTRENRHKVKQKTFTLCIRKKYFHYEYSQTVVQLVQGVCVPFILIGFQDRTG